MIFSSENKEFFVFGKNLDDIKKKINDIKKASRVGLIDDNGENGVLSAIFGGRPNSVEELRSRTIVRKRDLRSDFFMNEDAFSGFDENSARTLLAKMQKQQQKVNTKHSTWQAFFDEQANQYGKKESEWISKFVQENDVMTASVKNVTDAQEAARQAAVQYNVELKNLTIGSKAAAVGLEALALVGNILFNMAIGALISLAIQGIYNLTHQAEIAAQELENTKSELSDIESKITSVNDELKTTSDRINELEAKDPLTFVEQEELDKLKEQNAELERQKQILEAQEKTKNEKVTKDFVKAVKKEREQSSTPIRFASRPRRGRTITDDPTDNVEEKIDYSFEKYKKNQEDLIELQDKYKDDLSNKKFLKEKKRLDDEQEKIRGYLLSKSEKYTTMSEGIDYGMSDESDATLDWINAFQDKFNILINGDGAKTTAFNRIISQDKFKDISNELKNLDDVSEKTFKADKYKEFVNACNESGISVEDLVGLFEKTKTAAEETANSIQDVSVSLSNLATAEDGISKINSAFKEMADGGVISMNTISGISEAFQGVTGLDDCIEKLKNATAGSDEWKNALNDLLYNGVEKLVGGTEQLASMTEQEIANMLKSGGVTNSAEVAHSMLTQAKIKAKLATFNFAKATEAERTVLYQELEALGLTKNAVESLSSAYANAQAAMTEVMKIGTIGRISLLKSELEAVKSSVEAYNLLAGKYSTATGDTSGEAQRNINKNMSLGNNYGKQASALLNYGNALDGINAAINKLGVFDTVTPTFDGSVGGGSGGSDSGGSEKEPAAWEDATDAIIRRIKANNELTKKQEEVYENQLDLIDNEKEYAKAAQITNDELWLKKQRLEGIKSAQDELHNEAQWIRNNNGYDTESWFDDNADETEAYINLLNSLRSNEDELNNVKEIFAAIQKYKQAWLELDEEEISLQKEIYDTAKSHDDILSNGLKAKFDDRYSNSEDWIKFQEDFDNLPLEKKAQAYSRILNYSSEFLKEIENAPFYDQEQKDELWKEYYKKIQEYASDAYSTLKELYVAEIDARISKEEAYLDIKKEEFDLLNKTAEAQKNARVALRTSLIGSQYLDPETRKLVYNEDDYKSEIATINDINSYVVKLSDEYYKKIQGLTKDDIKLKEQITNEYKRQLAMKEQELEIAQKQIDLQKKRDELNNVLAERNVRQIVNGKWEWVYDTDKAREATEAFMDAEYELQNAKKKASQQAILDEHNAQVDMLNVEKNSADDFCKVIGNVSTTVDDFGNALIAIIDKINGTKTYSSNRITPSNKSNKKSTFYSDYLEAKSANNPFNKTKSISDLLNVKPVDIRAKNHYANGTTNAKMGWAELCETGNEVVMTNDGTLMKMNGGEIVFNPELTKAIWDAGTNSGKGLFDSFASKVNIPQIQQRTENIDRSTTFTGDINIRHVADLNAFMRAIIEEMRKPRG